MQYGSAGGLRDPPRLRALQRGDRRQQSRTCPIAAAAQAMTDLIAGRIDY